MQSAFICPHRETPVTMASARYYYSEQYFALLGSEFWTGGQIGRKPRLSNNLAARRHNEMFGCSPFLCSLLWAFMVDGGHVTPRSGLCPIHLLWALMFLKLYCTESVFAALCGCNEKTFRKWIWKVIIIIAELDVVRIYTKL